MFKISSVCKTIKKPKYNKFCLNKNTHKKRHTTCKLLVQQTVLVLFHCFLCRDIHILLSLDALPRNYETIYYIWAPEYKAKRTFSNLKVHKHFLHLNVPIEDPYFFFSILQSHIFFLKSDYQRNSSWKLYKAQQKLALETL